MHEYGHYVQYRYGITDSPGGYHTGSQNCIDLDRWSEGQDPKDYGIRLAWAEAYATVFGVMAQQYFLEILDNINTVGNSDYDSYNNYSYSLENHYSSFGEGGEISIQEILYDLYDNTNESGDTFSWGHEHFWNVLMSSEATTFSDFVNHLYTNNYIDKSEFGILLSREKMAVSNLAVDTITGDYPILTWSANGGSVRCPNNEFTIEIFKEDGTLIFSKAGITTNSYAFTKANWSSIVKAYGLSYIVGITAYQTTTFRTGGYYCSFVMQKTNKTTQLGNMLSVTNRYIEHQHTLKKGDVLEFYLYTQTAGTKMVQTFGVKDTIIELRTGTGVLLDQNDDAGYGYNAFLKFNSQANTEYIIRVYFYNVNESGDLKLMFIPANGAKDGQVEALEEYEDFVTSRGWSGFKFTSYATKGYVRAMVFVPPSTATYKIYLDSIFDSYLYVIDPRSTAPIQENVDYNDNGIGLNGMITKELEADVPYFIIYGQKDPSLDLPDVDDGYKISVNINKVE